MKKIILVLLILLLLCCSCDSCDRDIGPLGPSYYKFILNSNIEHNGVNMYINNNPAKEQFEITIKPLHKNKPVNFVIDFEFSYRTNEEEYWWFNQSDKNPEELPFLLTYSDGQEVYLSKILIDTGITLYIQYDKLEDSIKEHCLHYGEIGYIYKNYDSLTFYYSGYQILPQS